MNLRRIGIVIAAGALGAVLTGAPTFSAIADEKSIEELAENAKTAADHEAIAKLYDDEAAAARAKAAEHKRMGGRYKHVTPGGTKGQQPAFNMSKHCDNLVKNYDAAAKEAEALAAGHRAMGKAAK